MEAYIMPLGAGREIGRSCIMLHASGANVMLDCGVHLSKRGADRLPAFDAIGGADGLGRDVHAIVVTHFHLDHIGALPYVTESLGYRGPIVMTAATAALAPLTLDDYHSICEKRGDPLYTREQIAACLRRVTPAELDVPLRVPPRIELTAHYAGHVIGAAMFTVRAGAASVLYTGDYSTTADRHLGAARLPRILPPPDALISEATYGAAVKEPRRAREQRFLDAVAAALRGGGKVLVPVNALGSAQELSALVSGHCRRQNLQVPLYMTDGMARRAAALCATLVEWASQSVQRSAAAGQTAFDSPHFEVWRPELVRAPGPCVLFATPGALHDGVSLRVFKAWAPDAKNLVMMPSYAMSGTIGRQLLKGPGSAAAGGKRTVTVHGEPVTVRSKVETLAFSLHTDCKGIVDTVRHVAPRTVILVHGDIDDMLFLQQQLQARLATPTYLPVNGDLVSLPIPSLLPVHLTRAAMRVAAAARGRASVQASLQELARGDDGRSALRSVLSRLTGPISEASNDADMPATALADAVLQRMAPGLPCISGPDHEADLAADGRIVLTEQAGVQRRACFVADDEVACISDGRAAHSADACSAAPPIDAATSAGLGAVESDLQEYVQHTARAVARWAADSGHGTIEVVEHGSMIQLGEIKARLVCAAAAGAHGESMVACGAEGSPTGAGFGQSTAYDHAAWAWEVLWGGTSKHVAEGLLLSEALMATEGRA